eukprot:1582429-Alexandrium_andersonii.AAC.1
MGGGTAQRIQFARSCNRFPAVCVAHLAQWPAQPSATEQPQQPAATGFASLGSSLESGLTLTLGVRSASCPSQRQQQHRPQQLVQLLLQQRPLQLQQAQLRGRQVKQHRR